MDVDVILENMPYGVVFQDSSGTIFKYNHKALELLGLDASQLLGRSSVDPDWHSIKEDGSNFKPEEHPAMISLRTGKPVESTLMGVFHPPKDHHVWIRIQSEPVLKGEEVDYVVTYFEDVTKEIKGRKELNDSRELNDFLLFASKQLNQAGMEDMDCLLPDLLQKFGRIIGADSSYVQCFESPLPPDKAKWVWSDPSLSQELKRHRSFIIAKIMDWSYAYSKNKQFVVYDSNHQDVPLDLHSLLKENGIAGLLVFPMINSKGQASGFAAIAAFHDSPYSFKEGVLKGMEFFADLLSAFFDRVKSFWSLGERIKELQCIYKVSQIAASNTDIDFDFLAEAVTVIPEGYLYPQETQIELHANNRVYKSKELDKPIGSTYQTELNCPSMGITYIKASLAEGLEFLEEEIVLLDRLADLLTTEMQRRAFTMRLEESNARHQFIAESESIYFLRVDLEGNLISCNDKYRESFQWLFKEKSISDESILRTIQEYHWPKVRKMVEDAVVNPGKVVSGEIDKPTRDNGTEQTFWEFKAMKDSKGKITEIHCIGLDITGIRSAERLAEKFKIVSDESTNGAVITNIEGVVEYINPRFCELTGLAESEIKGESADILFHPNFFEERDRLKDKLRENRFLKNEVVRAQFSSGQTLDVLVNATVVDQVSNPYVYYSILDISERLEQERKIIEQNARLEALLKSLPDQVFVNTVKGEYLEYYPGFNNQSSDLGFMIGRTIRDILPNDLALNMMSLIQESANNKEVKSLKYERLIEGEKHWFETVITPINESQVLRFVRDITIQKEYEEQLLRFNIAIHQSPVGIVIADLNGVIEYASPSNEKISGYRPTDLVGLSTRVFASGKTKSEVYAKMWEDLNAGRTWEGELLNRSKDGKQYWERLSIAPMKGAHGEVERFMALKQNINDERTFKENLIKQNEVFRKISNTQSHDVRAPIARILGVAELLKNYDLGSDELKELIESIYLSAQELDNTTRNIVKLSAEASRLDS